MPRLASIEKGGYYAFPDEHLPALASLFAPSKQGGKLLDPCAGEGRALDSLARTWQLTPYANELDDERTARCKLLFGQLQTVQGDLYQLKASNQAFAAVWCNPPYTWDSTGDEKRREFGMLKHALKWVQTDGYLLWCIYSHHITLDAAAFLAKHSRNLDVWRIPGLHLGEYTQVVAVAQIGQPSDDPAGVAVRLVQAGKANAWPSLTMQPTPCYEFPTPTARKSFVFTPKIVPPELALQFVREAGSQFGAVIQNLVTPEQPPEKITPVVRPRGGQLALILAAGLFNGLVLPTEKGRMAVRSTVESVEVQTQGDGEIDETDEVTVEREVYRTQSSVTITLLGEDGTCDDISGDGPIANFIKTHKPALMAYLDEHFAPLYNFDYSPLKAVLAYAKQGKLYPTQKHVIAACHTALQYRKAVILVGEPGVGKTICGATLAAALQPQMAAGQVTLVVCPPHLVEKWEREAKEAAPFTFVKILKNVDEVVAFMERSEANDKRTLNIGIISREAAKLGEGWAVAVNWRTLRTVRWSYGTSRPVDDRGVEVTGDRIITLAQPICPSCGMVITAEHDKSHRERRDYRPAHGGKARKPAVLPEPVTTAWLSRSPRYCGHCNAALWTMARTFSKGKSVGGQPKNPRTPLAEFIATRYADRLYLFIVDELHEAKSPMQTDQGEAMTVLANAATKVVGLTGTVFGGVASSLYGIEYIFNPRIRAKYPWGRGLNQWVRDMGSLERIVEYKPQYDKAGVYSGKRRVEQKPHEAPGCSPLLVAEVIDHCVFVGLQNLGKQMPSFEEIPVPIQPDPEITALYDMAKATLGTYLFQCRLEGDASALGMYLQTLLSWPNAPYRTELCIHRKRLDKDSDMFIERSVHTIPGLPQDRIYAKEQWLIDTVRDELAQGRGVAVFVRQTGERNIQPRIAMLLTEHIPTARPYILKSSVKADQRESLLNKQVAAGINVLICNPRLVQTGLDLVDFPTLIFQEVDYSLYVMGQASRRAWRLIQESDCKVYYPFYEGLMENQAVELVGRKQQAAALLYGENTSGGLSALNGSDGGNLLAVLASEISSDNTVIDLRDLFVKHAAAEHDLADSAWFTATTDDAAAIPELMPSVEPLLLTAGTPESDPDLTAATPTDVLALLAKPLEVDHQNVGILLPANTTVTKTSPKKRRKFDLTRAPEDGPFIPIESPCPEPPFPQLIRIRPGLQIPLL